MNTTEKASTYALLTRQLESLVEGETNAVAIMANAAALLRQTFNFFWVGFYVVEGAQLVLGPFQGDVACFRILSGRGVCGTAWDRGETIVVDDVETFPGHIACSHLSRSEIVVPLRNADNEVCAVLDIDSTFLAAFDNTDRIGLEACCAVLEKHLFA